MMDHVTQILCHPIYYVVKRTLALTDRDATNIQQRGTEISNSVMSNGRPVQSIDVTAITDRIPLEIQLVVLEELLLHLGILSHQVTR